jgi:predicted acyltransferase
VSYGRNAIAVFVASGFLADTLSAVRWPAAGGTLFSLNQRLYAFFPASVLTPYAASFVWALMMVVLFYLMAAFMDRRGIYLKV